MGAKDSKPSCISYEDAIKRVSDTELKRIKEAFKRSAGTGNTCLSKSAFIQDVLCEGVPLPIAECLYAACGGTQKGISFKDLICGLVLLAKGSQEEKIRFLFNLYCNESGTHIIKHDFIRALQTELPQQTVINNNNWVSLFGQTDRVTFEQFKSWITIHRQGTVLGRWLLVEPVVNLSSELETPTFFQSLAGVTHLEEQDIRELEKVFWRLKGSAVTGQLDLESVSPLLSPPVPRNALAGVFNAFDENRDGHIDFKELCCGVSAACRGPSVERSKFCFKVFDTDRDGVLSHEELRQMVEVLLFVAQESNNFAFFRNMTHEAVMKELAERAEKKASEGGSIHRDDAFVFTQEDFLMWSIESSLNLVAQFLELLFEVCHVVFGLRPQCRHMEYDIVKGWLSREVKRGYRVGQFWYLISSEWWQNWLQHTQNVPPSSCSHCKVSRNGSSGATATGFDEAVVCDESFTSNSTESMGDLLTAGDSTSLGSCSSGISYGRTVSVAPGPIDNRSLIAPTIYKNVPTLTGEGGRLKRDSTLAQHRDFELVPDSLWKALALWYQGPLPLPRQVIQPPGNPDVEVELYPLNLRILRHHYPQNQTSSQQQQQNTLGSNAWGIVSGGYGVLNTPSGITGNVTASSLASSLQPPKKYLAYMAAFSKLATVKQVCEFLCQRLKLRQEDVRLWHVLGGSQSGNSMAEMPYLLEEEKATLQELMINDNDQLLLECRNKDLTWPEELSALSISGANPVAVGQERRSTVASIHSVHPAGATGLHNLGNTCFMNAALQVMFNTQPLARYFQQDMHLYELNTSNKLGTKGQLAMRYSELLKEVWTASARSIAPLKLRFCVTKNAPQFAGGGQHDSQEFLEWLLDALHEDLNRVMEKSYSELKDSDGRADCVVAAEAWSQHNARNQSIVIDLFYGQLKSKVTCLGCGKDSVRFDPFSLLSLPLPVENYTYCEVLVIFLDGSVPIKYGLRLNSDAKYMELKMELSHVCNLDPDLMLCCEILESQVRTILQDDQKVKASTATELYVYELPKMGGNERSLCNSEIGLSIEKGLKDIQRHQGLLASADNYQSTISSTVSSITTSSEDTASGQPLTGGSTASGDNAHDEGTSTQPQATAVRKKSAEIERKSSKVSRCLGNTLCMPQTLLCFKQMDMGTSPDNAFVPPNYGPNKTISTTNLLTSDRNSGGGGGDHVTGAMKDNDSDASDGCDRCASGGGGGGSFDGPPQGGFPPNGLRRMTRQKASRYLIAVHRQLSRQDTYFLSYHKTKPHLFGTPLLIPCHEGSTNKDLYCAVWLQVARLLSPLPPTPPDRANHATDCDDSLGYEFPFTLRAVASGGRICALCPWFRFCRGCEIPCNNDSLVSGLMATQSIQMSSTASTPIMSHRDQAASIHRRTQSEIGMCGDQALSIDLSCISIAIDWDPTALHLRYQSTREKVWTMHESVTVCRRQQTEPVDLNHCLRAFTSEEKLEQWYYCSHCKGKQPATKKLQIWKLPPILIIHLKRFNYVNNKWVKSQKVVNFPYDEFDPTPYLASVPQETILRHRELYAGSGTPCEERIDENSVFSSSGANKMGAEGRISCIENGNEGGGTMLRQERRKRLISGSLTKTPVNDEDLVDFHKHKLKSGVDPLDLKYQLYAVVSHSGMLNGGHYISYAANPNGSWFCYNDSSCREIPHRPQIDPGSAYLLFYERKELDYSPYLPKVSGRPIANGAMDIDDESELRKMCTIA